VDRAQKAEVVDSLSGMFADAGVVVVTHYSGLTVAEITDLRTKMREEGASFKVTKNRLAKRALSDTDKASLTDFFTGPTAVAISEDPISAPKIAVKFAKENEKLVILGGMMGETLLDVDGVKALAELPSLDELRAKLVGMISTPATRIAMVTSAPAGQLARVLNAYSQKGEAA
jgi:large subunit ribosomal protein L10